MQKDLKQRYEKLVKCQDHIKINIEKYDHYQCREDMTYLDSDGKEWLLESRENMTFAVEKWVEQFQKVTSDNVFYIFGLGHIAYLEKMREKFPDNVIIIYEPNEENVIRLLQTGQYRVICEDKRCVLLAGEERKETLIRILDVTATCTNYKRVLYAEIPNYHKIWEEDYKEFHQCLKNKMEDNLVERYTLVKQGRQRAQNQVYNLKSFFREAGLIDIKNAIDKEVMERYPVVIVGAGPSLDKNIDVLRQYQGRTFIICVESALNKLVRHGIMPDLNVAVDPSLGLGKKYPIEDERCRAIPLLTDVECSWTYIDQFKGRKFYFALNADFYDYFLKEDKVGYLGTGGSVAQNAFSLARYLNAKHIILIGQDFAYPDGKIHANGVLKEDKIDEEKNIYFYVDGVDGKPVLTETIMDIYRKWYEDVLVLEKQWHVIDATEGGALIKGTEVMSLKEALETYCPERKVDFRTMLDSADYFLSREKQTEVIKQIDQMYNHIERNVDRFQKIRRKYKTLLELNRKRKNQTAEFKQCMKEISDATSELENDVELMLYRMYTNQKSYDLQDSLEVRGENNVYEEIDKIANNGIEIIDAYILAAQKLKKDWEKFYMGKENIKLTISVLISGNKENVTRCLQSLNHLMQEVPSELILTDTGCSPEVRDLIENYTDHIINFTWCQDFSAARNVGLQEARGQWFLYLDDDEWFENTEAIENFLLSEQCDEYQVAFYKQRNYLDMEGKTYLDHNVDRLIRIQPGLHFERRIHEAYAGIEIQKKYSLASYVHHYGYVYRNLEEKLAKHKRNQELLDLECKERPWDMRMQYQAVINLFDTEEWDMAQKRAHEVIQRKSDSEYWDACHTVILYCYERKEDYQQIIQEGTQFLKKSLCPYDKFGTLQFIINAYWELKAYGEILPFAKQALLSYALYKKNPQRYNKQQLMRTEFLQEERIYKMLAYAIFAGLICADGSVIQLALTKELLPETKALFEEKEHKQWIQNTLEIVAIDDAQKNLADWIKQTITTEALAPNSVWMDINLLNMAEELVWLLRRNYSMRAGVLMSKFLITLEGHISEYAQIAGEEIITMLGLPLLMEAQQNEDEILMADVLEGQTILTLENIVQQKTESLDFSTTDYLIENLAVLETNAKLGELLDIFSQAYPREGCLYRIETTSSGQPTICLEENEAQYYLSGNNNPYRDAHRFWEANIEEGQYKYVMLGAGMLYEAQVILDERPDIELVMVEEDPYLLSLVFQCRDLTQLLENERFQLVIDSYVHYLGSYEQAGTILIHKPSMRHIQMQSEKEVLEEFYVKIMTNREQQGLLEWNYRQNITRNKHVVSSENCREDFCDKNVWLVAGGPSLDVSMDILKYRKREDIVLCVGTSAKLLISKGIIPDYVIVSDGMNQVCTQIEDIDSGLPIKLLYLCTANAKAVKTFEGEKYAIFQSGYDEAEIYAMHKEIELVSTGGSVSTTAIDLCIRYGCRQVICLGLDLAYTNHQSHVSGALSRIATDGQESRYQVQSVDGGVVDTIPSLNAFRKWIEKRIKGENGVQFINISCGAYIDGMDNLRPEEYRKLNHD